MAEGGKVVHREGAKNSPRPTELARLMRAQCGVVGARQLHALGYSPREIAGMVASGQLWRVQRGVYADARSPMTPRGHLFAAVLTVAPDSFLSHRTAAALHGLRALTVMRIELTVVAAHTPKRPPLWVHRVGEPPRRDELRTRDGLTYSSALRMLVELAPRETPDELRRLITEVARKRLLDPRRLELTLARHAGAPGIGDLRVALAAYRPTPADKSGFEREFACWLAREPRIPPPQRNVRLDRWELDFYWPDHRVAAETDGDRYHMLPGDRERDNLKDVWLQRHRISVMRVSEFRFEHDRPGVLEDLLDLLGLGEHPPPRGLDSAAYVRAGGSPPVRAGGS